MTDSRKQAADSNGITLREFIDAEITALSTKLDERNSAHVSEHRVHEVAHAREHTATQTAIDTATTALDRRLDSMNEFRDQLKDQTANFATKDQVGDLKDQLLQRIDLINKTLASSANERASTKGYILGVGAVLGMVVIIANFVAPFVKP